MNKWYQIHEQSAGTLRLELLWFIYKIFGIRFLKFILWFVCLFIVPFAKPAREASKKYNEILNNYQRTHGMKETKISAFSHIYAFACGALDKMSANCDNKTKIKFMVYKNADWDAFQSCIQNNMGAFLICSHLGNIEALSAFPGGKNKKMHAFMQVSQNAIFHKFMTRHTNAKNTIIYPTEDINMGVASTMYDFLQNGDLVMMAGDRTSPNTPARHETVPFLGTDCRFPVGTFKFAKSMSHPIFAICIMNVKGEKYGIYVKKIDATTIREMVLQYATFLEKLILKYPKQWFNFFDFFETDEKSAKN